MQQDKLNICAYVFNTSNKKKILINVLFYSSPKHVVNVFSTTYLFSDEYLLIVIGTVKYQIIDGHKI